MSRLAWKYIRRTPARRVRPLAAPDFQVKFSAVGSGSLGTNGGEPIETGVDSPKSGHDPSDQPKVAFNLEGEIFMHIPNPICESCRLRPVEKLLYDDDPQEPYRICLPCEERLIYKSLRPREWFNLASLHSCKKYLLHSDYYADNGVAQQPEREVDFNRQFAAPTRVDVQDNLVNLVDFAMTREHLDEATVAALAQHSGPVLLDLLKLRFVGYTNPAIACRCYEIAGRCLCPLAQDWLREQWKEWSWRPFHCICDAVKRCLPFEEAWTKIIGVFDDASVASRSTSGSPGIVLNDDCFVLSSFRSARVLLWIENHGEVVNHDHWGRVAALSDFTWATAESWLNMGRPFSHLALTAMVACHHYNTPQLQYYRPTIKDRPSVSTIVEKLDDYYSKDPVPKVRRLIRSIRTALEAEQMIDG